MSSIPAARSNLIGMLEAVAVPGESLEGVEILRSGVWSENPALEVAVVLNARDIEQEWRVLGGRRIDESYTIPIRVIAYEAGEDLESVENRLWAIVAAIRSEVASDLTLGGVLTHCTPTFGSPEESGPAVDNNGVVANVRLDLRCEAQFHLLS